MDFYHGLLMEIDNGKNIMRRVFMEWSVGLPANAS